MKKLDRATMILTRLVEIGHWIGAVSMLVGLVLTVFMGERAVIYGAEDAGTALSTYGFEVMVVDGAGQLNMTALRLFLVGAAVLLGLMAMVFRNIHLILKNSQGNTPFQKDIVRMVREIGIFILSLPLVGLVMNIVIRLAVGVDAVETSEDLGGIVIGLVVLCLSRIFARGMELENDVDGLI